MKEKYQLKEGHISLSQTHLHTDDKAKAFLTGFFTAIFVIAFTYRTSEASIKLFQSGGMKMVLGIGIAIFIIAGLLWGTYYVFFVKDWRSKVALTDLTKIIVEKDDDDNDIDLKLYFSNNRKKGLTFRKLENEHERFLTAIKKYRNCPIETKEV